MEPGYTGLECGIFAIEESINKKLEYLLLGKALFYIEIFCNLNILDF